MKFSSAVLFVLAFAKASGQECNSPSLLTCQPTDTAPTFDGDVSDWDSVEGVEASLTGAMTGMAYDSGAVSIKCQYTSSDIYFAIEIPGGFSFNNTNNEKCAAIGTMFKVGKDATYFNMGGCPYAMEACAEDPTMCADYTVDIGAHWELASTEQGVEYGPNEGTGDDGIANKDDEYSSSPFCRADDDGQGAANEWTGAWAYEGDQTSVSRQAGQVGSYVFELGRSLTTSSTATDVQLQPGEVYQFGFAYWDPLETEEGWTDDGHYVTGCTTQWMDLWLKMEGQDAPSNGGDGSAGSDPNGEATGSGAATYLSSASAILAGALVGHVAF